ncbi:hypothetical protein ACFFQF_03925 [Haladaptatus pallidirubidus]|uniref:Cox cluster protein n=1 Tax=Haladaptatus pallidirubidus TaxID=1008152 RepID=A0AAV3UKR5_9EURY|nr:hypothetical protein [Haladaptatus pallidirubidus]
MSERVVSSRPIFLATATVVVLLAGAIGFVVGTTGQNRGATMDIFGVSLFQMSPVTMALFGMILTTCVLALVFGLVTYASRYDTERTT